MPWSSHCDRISSTFLPDTGAHVWGPHVHTHTAACPAGFRPKARPLGTLESSRGAGKISVQCPAAGQATWNRPISSSNIRHQRWARPVSESGHVQSTHVTHSVRSSLQGQQVPLGHRSPSGGPVGWGAQPHPSGHVGMPPKAGWCSLSLAPRELARLLPG